VLTEVKKIIEGEEVETREGYHNETLQKLIDIWSDFEAMSTRIGLSHYEFFKTMDMHQSAYNLLYESMFYDNIDLNRDSLESLLKTERIDTDIVKPRSVFIMDNTK
jgi:diphthamide biosynthesis methyltransferase